MSIRKLQVFLAVAGKGFGESSEILASRLAQLQSPAVEVTRDEEAADRADIAVLLLGNPQTERDLPHVISERALADPSKIVLPFVSSASVRERWENGEEPSPAKSHRVIQLGSRSHPVEQIVPIFVARMNEVFGDDADEEVPRRLLAASRSASDPLQVTAASHGASACESLKLGRAAIAMQELQKAVAVVPLDFVSNYWLARLLIATNGISQCRDGLDRALLCADVASHNPQVPPHGAMAALLLAARASERIGDLPAALNWAQDALQLAPDAWRAHLELARQYALADDTHAASRHARTAFWKEPRCAASIEHEPAFRRMGAAYKLLMDELKHELWTDAQSVMSLEGGAFRLASTLGTDDQQQVAAHQLVGEAPSLERLVELTLQSSQHTLRLLQRTGKRVTLEVENFSVGPYAGLTEESHARIRELVAEKKKTRAELQQSLAESEKTSRKTLSRARMIAVGALTLAAILGVMVWRAIETQRFIAVVPLTLLIGIILWTALARASANLSRHLKVSATLPQLRSDVEVATNDLNAALKIESQWVERATTLRGQLKEYSRLVDDFETAAMRRPALAPEASLLRDLPSRVRHHHSLVQRVGEEAHGARDEGHA